jgi:hypothetical protein
MRPAAYAGKTRLARRALMHLAKQVFAELSDARLPAVQRPLEFFDQTSQRQYKLCSGERLHCERIFSQARCSRALDMMDGRGHTDTHGMTASGPVSKL